MASFLDHDSPDYAVDGKIVLANGLTATSADGQASDMFPAYWSPEIRQYVNYDGHNGYDFTLNYQPVLAAGAGTIKFAGWNGDSAYAGYGQMVLIDHHNGYVSLYGHLSQLEVKKGDHVAAGQEIAVSGSTGRSSGPHLHFSVFHDCQVTDPFGWTGSSRDPLTDFNNEKSGYLWLPGHDPLVLNPPPHWPTYPLGLRFAVPQLAGSETTPLRGIPPADRLLLLRLPDPHLNSLVSAEVAVARTESLIVQEGEAVVPQLRALQELGLVDNYQLIPAAAAIWVRGRATAQELEALPGVASLAGVQPHDISAGQAGLAHSILIQVGQHQAPSLWPIGFRSSLHAWRPLSTVVLGHALLTGFALPGQHVIVSLHRGADVAAVAQATCDPETGGFVAALHDVNGTLVPVRAHDVVEIDSSGKSARTTVLPLSVQARVYGITGKAPPGSTVPIAVFSDAHGPSRSGLVSFASRAGTFHVDRASALLPGTLAVASVVDAAGNVEGVSGFVPGIEVQEGGTSVRGWTVSSQPLIGVHRGGRLLFTRKIKAAGDGTFHLELRSHHLPFQLRAGDVVTVGSRWHPRRIYLVPLNATITSGSARCEITAPSGSSVDFTYARGSVVWKKSLHIGPARRTSCLIPGGPARMGDVWTLRYTGSTGDIVSTGRALFSLHLHLRLATLDGVTRPGSMVGVQVANAAGHIVGGAVGAADAHGKFTAVLAGAKGGQLRISPAMRILVRVADGMSQVTVPSIVARPLTSTQSRVESTIGGTLSVTLHGSSKSRTVISSTAASPRQVLLSPLGQKAVSATTTLTDAIDISESFKVGSTGRLSAQQYTVNAPRPCSVRRRTGPVVRAARTTGPQRHCVSRLQVRR